VTPVYLCSSCHPHTFKRQVAPSPVPGAPRVGNYEQYHDILDRHKQKMADGERNMDDWNKGTDITIQSLYWKTGAFQ
jgi:hypothetical protein